MKKMKDIIMMIMNNVIVAILATSNDEGVYERYKRYRRIIKEEENR